jgi:hypothetical protein
MFRNLIDKSKVECNRRPGQLTLSVNIIAAYGLCPNSGHATSVRDRMFGSNESLRNRVTIERE